MKKPLLLSLALCFFYSLTYSQTIEPEKRSLVKPSRQELAFPVKKNISNNAQVLPEEFSREINGRIATYVPLGTLDNGYGLIGLGPNTYLWTAPYLNAITYTRKTKFGFGYDVSFDGGATWEIDNQVDNNINYPFGQGGIINPEGNYDPDNAYYTFIAELEDKSKLIGYNVLTDNLNPNFIYDTILNPIGYYKDLSTAFTISQTGVAYCAGMLLDDNNYDYANQLIVGKIQIVNNEFVYTEQTIDYILPEGETINDIKIDFDPYGIVGYICVLSNQQVSPVPYTNYHPVLFKTTDGGNTWSDPINIQFGGVDGIESIKYYWSDLIIESIYGAGFDRDEIYYNMGYHCDIVVDSEGNPHIIGLITLASEDGWYPSEGTMTTWHVFYNEDEDSYDAVAMYDNIFFDGDLGGLEMYNMPYAASTIGDLLAFSWNDTDLDGAEGNTNPNIFMVMCNPIDNWYTDVDNVTELTLHWFSAYYANLSRYFFCEDSWDGEAEIPMTFIEFEVPGDPSSQVNFWYIDGYTTPFYSGTPCLLADVDEKPINRLTIELNAFPNPSSSKSSIIVNTTETGVVKLTICDNKGRVVSTDEDFKTALVHNFKLDLTGLKPGIYFLTASINGESTTEKFVVN